MHPPRPAAINLLDMDYDEIEAGIFGVPAMDCLGRAPSNYLTPRAGHYLAVPEDLRQLLRQNTGIYAFP